MTNRAQAALTIGQLASYAGVTVRAVRHYHQQGLLAEPCRDASGYRSYDAATVVRLIRIRTLAQAGVPLNRVSALLDADPDTFQAAVADIDESLRRKIDEMQEHRRRIARLAAGDALALPDEAVDYLQRLRDLGVPEAAIRPERDVWIMFAARWPEAVSSVIADKVAHLDDPLVIRLYELIKRLADDHDDEHLLEEIADLIVELHELSAANGELDRHKQYAADARFVRLMDSFAVDTHPAVQRLQDLVSARGWSGWSWMEKRQ